MTVDDLAETSACTITGTGVCAGMGTANSMHITAEALGMALPGSTPVLANSPKMWRTVAEAGRRTIPAAIEASIAPVVGTTGFQPGETETWAAMCRKRGLGGAFIANYAVGIMLLMRFAEEAHRFFPDVEIIEMHHKTKLDAPSGTALRTKARLERGRGDLAAPEVPVHSVRLPGLVAHQEVIFGGLGETLTIRHDAPTREAYVPGVLMTCRWVLREKRVAFDLEEVAFPRA